MMNKPKINRPSRPIDFLLADISQRDTLIAHLQQEIRCTVEPCQHATRIYYDSFDWRLYQADLCLYKDQSRQFRRYVLQSRSAGKNIAMQENTEATAVFAQDLATGLLRDKIAPLLEMRALLPLINIQQETLPIRVMNKAEKTVARIVLEHNAIRQSATSRQKIDDYRARVIPLRGFWKAASKLRHTLEQYPHTIASNEGLYDLAIRSLCLTPGEYSSKIDIPLNAQDRADHAMQLILNNLYHTMLANEQGIAANIDSEFLHDFRVAVRRTRSALTQIKQVLPQTEVDKFKAVFSWLGSVTNLPRDLDVHLLNFDTYASSLPDDMRGDLEPLRDYLHKQRTLEYKNLKKTLRSARYRRFKQDWEQFLDTGLCIDNPAESAEIPIVLIAKQYTWRAYRRALKQGNALNPDSPAMQYHELRKTCKKLRYLMEFFASLFPKKEIKPLIRTLKSLQGNLGDFQDLEVHAQSMRVFAEQMLQQEHASSRTLMAMGALAENLEHHKMAIHQEFSDVYQAFQGKKNRDLFESLFKPQEKLPESVL
ncbi:MAG: CHAD domain-containing protein [Gammaproteobacteria bacterium]|nr:CHAD domain-containing protein [Gammaproteobacteria bacterium]